MASVRAIRRGEPQHCRRNSYYPTVTGVSPASAASIPAGSTTTSVTVTWTAPAGSTTGGVNLLLSGNVGNIYGGSGDTVNVTIGPTPVTTPFSVSGLTAAPTGGFASMGDIIGGLDVLTVYPF
jgi:hypothetical protein